MIRVQRHELGPRLYVLGRRIHECAIGLVVLAVLGFGGLAGLWRLERPVGLGLAAGGYMVIKDWRDLVPSRRRRNRAAWSVGVHRPRWKLRPDRRAPWLPRFAALVIGVLGVVNLVSALTPNASWRGHTLLQIEPVTVVPIFHALALPASVLLLVLAFYLARRRRRAAQIAIALLIAFVPLNVLKGLDIEEAVLCGLGAVLLWWGREAFTVQQERIGLRSSLWRLLVVIILPVAAATVVTDVATDAGLGATMRETGDLLLWRKGHLLLRDELGWVPLTVRLAGLLGFLIGAYLLFRPLGGPRRFPGAESRRRAAALVHRHGHDTLSFFKLRRDKHYLFSADGHAFLGYRVEGGVMLVSGDPVGPPDALPALVRETCAFAELRGLKVGAVGASAELAVLWKQAGMRALYLGDEAIVEIAGFSLEGRAVRKIRQSVSRLEKAGFTVETLTVADLDERTLAELERVSERWRGGAEERGFAMAMDDVRGDCEHAAEGLVVAARDEAGKIRGFLHFVPTFGRPAMSLSHMRRDPDTPNGLTEFLIVNAIEAARGRGLGELSLNFATFARYMHAPSNRAERVLGALAIRFDRFFQIESLYRFNAKFSPRWEPRYLIYEGALGLPRVGLAAAWAEGQLPKLKLPKAFSRHAAQP